MKKPNMMYQILIHSIQLPTYTTGYLMPVSKPSIAFYFTPEFSCKNFSAFEEAFG